MPAARNRNVLSQVDVQAQNGHSSTRIDFEEISSATDSSSSSAVACRALRKRASAPIRKGKHGSTAAEDPTSQPDASRSTKRTKLVQLIEEEPAPQPELSRSTPKNCGGAVHATVADVWVSPQLSRLRARTMSVWQEVSTARDPSSPSSMAGGSMKGRARKSIPDRDDREASDNGAASRLEAQLVSQILDLRGGSLKGRASKAIPDRDDGDAGASEAGDAGEASEADESPRKPANPDRWQPSRSESPKPKKRKLKKRRKEPHELVRRVTQQTQEAPKVTKVKRKTKKQRVTHETLAHNANEADEAEQDERPDDPEEHPQVKDDPLSDGEGEGLLEARGDDDRRESGDGHYYGAKEELPPPEEEGDFQDDEKGHEQAEDELADEEDGCQEHQRDEDDEEGIEAKAPVAAEVHSRIVRAENAIIIDDDVPELQIVKCDVRRDEKQPPGHLRGRTVSFAERYFEILRSGARSVTVSHRTTRSVALAPKNSRAKDDKDLPEEEGEEELCGDGVEEDCDFEEEEEEDDEAFARTPSSSSRAGLLRAGPGAKLKGKAPQLLPRWSMRPAAASDGRYVPPHLKHREAEDAKWQKTKIDWRRRLEDEDAAGGPVTPRTSGPNIRMLARKWEPKLEKPGSCCFSLLQKDEGVDVSKNGIVAECVTVRPRATDLLRMGPGIKGLPTICGGRYQYEVELLKHSALVIGWSAATSLPSVYDFQAFGYSSNGCRVTCHDGSEEDEYGPSFGRAGDVVGVLVSWPPRRNAVSCPSISFMLNGQHLGTAFDLSEWCGCGDHPALQFHLCQAPGPAFHVKLRGAHPSAPLRFPARGYAALGDHTQVHFCPFSRAVESATDACAVGTPTVARRLIHGSLGVQLPLSHLTQERQLERQWCPSEDLHAENREVKFGGA